ncbi:hypothetical protein EX30DRAFT_325625 [Ascodesmis nigricans]|uniref:Uncharacterized protein n=1 Tax=Ascodesmis nigricans TaxID=341454 RepID=A0A4S2N668_9PEZI|nr:hypothetical protein EX30DRAFT_325625 [Ascodesmis nigricans]
MDSSLSEFSYDNPHAYHPVVPPDYALAERIRIHIEDGLFDTAISNIESILFSGFSDQPSTPGLLVPANYIRFLTTLLCHPFYTTQVRTKSTPVTAPENTHVLLRRIINVVGPISADLGAAWKFSSLTKARIGRRKQGLHGGGQGDKGSLSDGGDGGDDHISGAIANEESLFTVAEDFWSIVGWAFNCSVKHKSRWRYWRNVLDVMVLALERDWEDRLKRYNEAMDKKKRKDDNVMNGSSSPSMDSSSRKRFKRSNTPPFGSGPDTHLNNALILSFLPSTYGSAGYKRVIRSIFADGSERSTEFKELWPDELVRRRKKLPGRQDIGKTMSRDYHEESSDEEDERLDDERGEEDMEMEDVARPTNVVDRWGGLESLDFRQRLLTLISEVCFFEKFISVEDFMLQLTDNIRHLPLPSFSLFTTNYLLAHPSYRSCLAQTILDSIRTPQNKQSDSDTITLDVFINIYAPCPASNTTASDNVKISVLLEVLARLLTRVDDFRWSKELEEAVETGIKERRRKGTRLKPGETKEEFTRLWDAADRKLRMWVTLARDKLMEESRK